MALLDTAFTPEDVRSAATVSVVIDVLRMTTNAASLMASGLEELLVVADVADARRAAAEAGALLLGERGGLPLEGFDGGNSPRDHVGADLTGKRAVLCTSNGSLAVAAVAEAEHLLLGSIVNAEAVAARALELAGTRKATIILVCAGTNGRVSLDDALGAGCIAKELVRLEPGTDLTDGARISLQLADRPEPLVTALSRASHAGTLAAIGMSEDLEFAAGLNSFTVVPERVGRDPATFRDGGAQCGH